MSTPELEPEDLKLLRDVVEYSVENEGYPPIEGWAKEPWRADKLKTHGLVHEVPGFIAPTVAGLAACDTDTAREQLDLAREVYEGLRRAYRSDPAKTKWTSLELSRLLPSLDERTVQRLLALFELGETYGGWGFTHRGSLSVVMLRASILFADPFPRESSGDAVEPGPVVLEVQYFHGLRQVSWEIPADVCLLAGPNGSGKSSVLQALAFLRNYYNRGLTRAVSFDGGPAGIRHLDAPEGAPVVLALTVGRVRWEVRFGVQGSSLRENPGETVAIGEDVLLRRELYEPHWHLMAERRQSEDSSCLRSAHESGMSGTEQLSELIDVLSQYKYYKSYDLHSIRKAAGPAGSDGVLHGDGSNLYSVLRNWQMASRRYDRQFQWVMDRLRQAFPDAIEYLEFDELGGAIAARFYRAGDDDPERSLPLHRASDGMLVGLLHLAAVAGAPEGGIVAIDEMENQLHPHAIRCLLAAMRERAEERSLSVILTTHSPVLMNRFKQEPEQLFVTEPGHESFPLPLDELRDPDWLAHFSLGDLYDREAFGGPHTDTDRKA